MSAASSSRVCPDGIDVRVRVVRDLVAALEDRLRLLRERLDGVAGDEERRADAVPLEQVEHARDADPGAVLAAREHRRRRPLVAEPDGKRVEIEREADRARRHRAMLTIGLDRRLMLFEMGFLGSPRARRRLLWIGGLALVSRRRGRGGRRAAEGARDEGGLPAGRVGSDHAEERADDARAPAGRQPRARHVRARGGRAEGSDARAAARHARLPLRHVAARVEPRRAARVPVLHAAIGASTPGRSTTRTRRR